MGRILAMCFVELCLLLRRRRWLRACCAHVRAIARDCCRQCGEQRPVKQGFTQDLIGGLRIRRGEPGQ